LTLFNNIFVQYTRNISIFQKIHFMRLTHTTNATKRSQN